MSKNDCFSSEEDADPRITALANSIAYSSLCEDDEFEYECGGDFWEPTLTTPIFNHVATIGSSVDQEDDWISDSELCAPVELPPKGIMCSLW